jgi:hypothetical protein
MPGSTTRVSYSTNNRPFGFRPLFPSISDDGRYIAFMAPFTFEEIQRASRVTKQYNSVFVRDTVKGTTTLVSVPLGSSPLANSVNNTLLIDAPNLAISGSGRYVAFASDSPNLVDGDTNDSTDFFVRDLILGTTTRISVDSNENQARYDREPTNRLSFAASGVDISQDGRYIAFSSNANNLVSGDTLPESTDIFVRDTIAGTTEVISTRSNGAFSASQFRFATEPAISADGRYVTFIAVGSDFVPGDTNNEPDVFVKDRVTGITTRVSTDSNGNQGIDLINADSLGASAVENPSISADGRYVAFRSSFYNLVANDTNQLNDIFVKDRLTGITTRVSVDSKGNQANGTSYNPDISADGRYVTFASAASNLVDGDVLGAPDVFVHDRLSGTTSRVSVNSQGMQAMDGFGGTKSFMPTISGDGRFVAFVSNAANLVNDGFTTSTDQIFLRDTRSGEPLPNQGGDALTGNSGNGTLVGGGNDVLIARTGRQRLTGGAGEDQFVFLKLDKQPDRIIDFELGQDKIVLTRLLDRFTPKSYQGNPIKDQYVRLFRRGSSTLVSIDRNGERKGGLQALVIVEEISIAQLRNRSNFLF